MSEPVRARVLMAARGPGPNLVADTLHVLRSGVAEGRMENTKRQNARPRSAGSSKTNSPCPRGA